MINKHTIIENMCLLINNILLLCMNDSHVSISDVFVNANADLSMRQALFHAFQHSSTTHQFDSRLIIIFRVFFSFLFWHVFSFSLSRPSRTVKRAIFDYFKKKKEKKNCFNAFRLDRCARELHTCVRVILLACIVLMPLKYISYFFFFLKKKND